MSCNDCFAVKAFNFSEAITPHLIVNLFVLAILDLLPIWFPLAFASNAVLVLPVASISLSSAPLACSSSNASATFSNFGFISSCSGGNLSAINLLNLLANSSLSLVGEPNSLIKSVTTPISIF